MIRELFSTFENQFLLLSVFPSSSLRVFPREINILYKASILLLEPPFLACMIDLKLYSSMDRCRTRCSNNRCDKIHHKQYTNK